MTLVALPPLVVKSTGFRVDASLAGGLPKSGEQALGAVSFVRTGHASLTPTGIAAVLSHISTYFGGLGPVLLEHMASAVGIYGGSYSVQDGDASAEQAAIFGILSTAANVTGSAT